MSELTNEQVIDVLNEIPLLIGSELSEEGSVTLGKALRVAVEAVLSEHKVDKLDDLISRKDALNICRYYYSITNITQKIKELPSVNPHKSAKWEHCEGVYGVAFCSNCNYELHRNDTNFCPNCGSRMMKEGEEND